MANQKWEYKVVILKTGTFASGDKLSAEMEAQLNKYGQIGWELVEVLTSSTGSMRAIFKR